MTEIEAQANGWSKIEYNGEEAFVKTEFFERVDNGTEAGETQADTASGSSSNSTDGNATSKVESKKIKGDSVRLRKGQGTDSAILATMDKGSTVKVIEEYSNGWSKVEYDGQTGYIKSEFIDA